MAITAIIAALSPLVGDLIDRAFPDSESREQARLEVYARMQENLTKMDMAQLEVNKAEAASASVFVAGWRPFIGWVCGLAFAYILILQPFMEFCFAAYGNPVKELPKVDGELLGWAMGGMLGLGTMRTVEKVKGVTQGLSGSLPWRK
jgi:hypothetical protein